ncbi:hypothetical protein MALH04_00756 [Mycoplasma anatis]|nr:hypothetical protein [Mycoplasmopsis anatis]MBW0598599.1 hypothetical protein [Mycoplasmopsis anatis]MBW0599029.1 hypothetical protein [Mycoplasmopsis anatis]MBW0599854.1 hypothetical protein [Mycoplasmopsis anatis]MBW0600538.1 hypothetical protein [Mycoplasmopsis anatis]
MAASFLALSSALALSSLFIAATSSLVISWTLLICSGVEFSVFNTFWAFEKALSNNVLFCGWALLYKSVFLTCSALSLCFFNSLTALFKSWIFWLSILSDSIETSLFILFVNSVLTLSGNEPAWLRATLAWAFAAFKSSVYLSFKFLIADVKLLINCVTSDWFLFSPVVLFAKAFALFNSESTISFRLLSPYFHSFSGLLFNNSADLIAELRSFIEVFKFVAFTVIGLNSLISDFELTSLIKADFWLLFNESKAFIDAIALSFSCFNLASPSSASNVDTKLFNIDSTSVLFFSSPDLSTSALATSKALSKLVFLVLSELRYLDVVLVFNNSLTLSLNCFITESKELAWDFNWVISSTDFALVFFVKKSDFWALFK